MQIQTNTRVTMAAYSELPEKAQIAKGNSTTGENASVDGSKIAFPGNHTALQDLLQQRAQLEAQVTQMNLDNQMDAMEESLANSREGYLVEKLEHEQQIRHFDDLQKELKESNGITEGSEEDKDLSVLLKVSRGQGLTTEEQERLKNHGELTECERAIIDYDKMSQLFEQRAKNCEMNAKSASLSLQAIRLDRLKSSPMLEVKKEVETLLSSIEEQIRVQLAKEQIPEEEQKGLLVDEKI